MRTPSNHNAFLSLQTKIKEAITKHLSLITGFLFCVCLVLSYLYFFHAHSLSSFQNKNKFLNPSLAVLGEEDLIVDFQELREYLTNTYENRDDYLVSIYFEYFPTGANIAVNKDEKIWPASLIKIPVAMAVMKKVQDKKWKLTNELVILDEDKDSEYGTLYQKPTGTTLTINHLLEKTLVDSDNTAHFVLLRNLDSAELEEVYVHLGFDDIIQTLKLSPKKENEVDNRMTAKRYSIFFRSLYNATFLNQEYSELFLKILDNAPRDLLGQGIPSTVTFVHKTGIRIDERVRADSGIIYAGGRPYLLTVMIQKKNKGDVNEEEVAQLFKDISSKTYNYVTQAR